MLAWLVDRERQSHWRDPSPGENETRRLELHENLLLVATVALNIKREKLESATPDFVRRHLPDEDTLDANRYRRMAGGNSRDAFQRLEPDILGEFFVLDTLRKRPASARQALIDASLELGGDGAAVFLSRCATDFPEEWRRLRYLTPTRGLAAFRAFALASVYQTGGWRGDRIEDITLVAANTANLSMRVDDVELHRLVAITLFNKGVTLGNLGRSEDAIAVYDEVVERYGAPNDAALRQQVGSALVNKGVRLGTLGRFAEEIAVYDEVLKRYGAASEPALRQHVGWALYNKGIRLLALRRSVEEIAVHDEIVERFGTANELVLRELVVKSLFNKGVRLGALGRFAEEIAVYDAIVKQYGDASEPALREQVAKALVNKGARLNALRRPQEAIAVLDEIAARYGAPSEAVLREIVTWAAFHRGKIASSRGRRT